MNALRDFGLLLGAVTLNRLATAHDITTMAQEVAGFREEQRVAA